jgi:DNA primase
MIAEETIERVRNTVSIVQVIGESVRLVRKGRSWSGLCPFHKEKTPSFYVSDERSFYRCYGCGASGDNIAFMQEHHGLSFQEAVRSLADRSGITVVETDGSGKESTSVDTDPLYEAAEFAAKFFQKNLTTNEHRSLAESELLKREVDPCSEHVLSFRLGYAPPGWSSLADALPKELVEAAEKIGLVASKRSGGYYDKFRNRLMFPVIDLRGRVIGFSGRELPPPPGETQQEKLPKYVNSPESEIYKKRDVVFGLHQAKGALRHEGCIVVEGNFDVVGLHARGITSAVAPLGTAFTPEQARLVSKFTKAVVLMFDGDRAGREAVIKSHGPCKEGGLLAKVAVLPDGTDPDAYARSSGPEAIREVAAKAVGIIEHLINQEASAAQLSQDAETKSAHLKRIRQLVDGEDDPVVRAIADQCAYRASVMLAGASDKKFRAFVRAASPNDPGEAAKLAPSEENFSFRMLGCLLDCPSISEDASVRESLESLSDDYALAAMDVVSAWRQSELDQKSFAKAVPPLVGPRLRAQVEARLVAPEHESPDDAKRELFLNAKKLQRKNRRLLRVTPQDSQR